MVHSTQYISTELNYVPVSGVVAEDVVDVHRNGIGVKFNTAFEDVPLTVDVYSFQWYGVDTSITLDSGAYIIKIYDSVGLFRTVLYEFGPTVGVGYVYLFTNGTNFASYAAAPLDTAEQVRDGIETALNAVSWGFTFTTLALGTNQLKITFTNTDEFQTFIGRSTYKTGYYCSISGVDYQLYYADNPNAYPTLPSYDPDYDFSELVEMVGGIEAYLDDPNSDNTFSDTLEGVTDINGIPGPLSVPDQECVISESEQRIYFHEVLNFGELIKVFQK